MIRALWPTELIARQLVVIPCAHRELKLWAQSYPSTLWASTDAATEQDQAGLASLDGDLGVQLEVFHAVRERAADPGLEAGVIVRHVAAPRQPGAEQPLERAKFQIDSAAQFNLRDSH